MILTLKTIILFLHKPIKLTIYFPVKCGCRKISSSADMVETVTSDYMSHDCDPELEDSKPIFLQDTLTYDDASPYQVWLQKAQQLRRYCPDESSLKTWTFPVTLTRTIKEQFNLFTRQFSLWWCAIKPSLTAKWSAVQKTYQKIIFWLFDPSLQPWPWRQQTNLFGRQSGT